MDKKQFKEYLLLHGSNIHAWPEEIMRAGLETLEKSPDFKILVNELEHFERLLKSRRYEQPSNNIEERIISASLQKEQNSFSLRSFVSALLNDFHLPRPALTTSVLIILLLAVGFTIGFFNPSDSVSPANDETSLQAFLYYEEDTL